ncbi:MAG: thioredoxin family protein [Betaproteobacteria bacterium TMED156]|nr:MAG: thioredoxin family protein [Betaproteobacteria bacterium TMED156]|tara:strand:+ start:1633 stop:2193 length:561 start_codon:yes stop_codon:yes gene_type:complete
MPKSSEICQFNWDAPNFDLKSTKGEKISLKNILMQNNCKGVLIMFICNHCPYVKAIIKKIVRECDDLKEKGIYSIAICSNDSETYPEDSFDNMRIFDKQHKLVFPYLHDEDQKVAKSFNAICTPDFFGLNKFGKLQYRGRLDSDGSKQNLKTFKRELYEAMKLISISGNGPIEQFPSIGCSIKWKN